MWKSLLKVVRAFKLTHGLNACLSETRYSAVYNEWTESQYFDKCAVLLTRQFDRNVKYRYNIIVLHFYCSVLVLLCILHSYYDYCGFTL